MARIRKVALIVLLSLCFISICYSKEVLLPKKIKNSEEILSCVNVQHLYEGQKGYASEEDFEYSCKIAKIIDSFFSSLYEVSVVDNKELIGNYKLVDKEERIITESNGFFLSNYITILSIDEKTLSLQDQDSTTKIYHDSNNCMYFCTPWLGAIRQCKLIDDKLYIYTLNDNYWYLDSIHENGKYFYKKVDSNVNDKVINVKEWMNQF